MSDLLARLQEHLGQTYRIERELGGGGMSRVFLAIETRLGRKVVIKVLPPEMAAAVHADRFEREIQVAASLQHPHIVSLLTAGSAGDVLYYVMPFIEGESLGARLAREGALPVNDAVRILRDVVDALAYSHAHGVVHRDIKPDNILLTGRHALVTDFGVAKAVSLSSGPAGLTSTNVALGTPAYMAPEQAAADPHVDQRADLYAVGVVAYEMLTGRTPFQAPTPQQMLAAHVTRVPDSPDRWRPGLPPALTGTIMKCLVKHAADRWQTADELAAVIDVAVPTSGGITPVGTAAHPAAPLQQALRRFDPLRVSVRFLVATLVVVVLAFALTRIFALPDWVWVAALAVMLAGLPVMLYTGRIERQRAVALTMGTAAVAAPAHHAWFTWHRAKLGGIVALGVVVLATAGFAAGRLFGIGPGATLRSSGKLGAADRMILADFANRTNDSTLGATLTEAARVDLSQSNVLHLLSGQELTSARRRMGLSSVAALTDSAALDLARREGAKAVVTGEVRSLGTAFVLTGRILDAAGGAELLSGQEQAASTTELLPALDRLERGLRERAGESLRSLRAQSPLEQVTTPSLDALRMYTDGVRVFAEGHEDQAIPLLRRAVAIDPGFAMAWRKLATAYGNLGNGAMLDSAMTVAFTLRDRLPALERDLTEAGYYDFVTHQADKAEAAYRDALTVSPGDPIATNNLANLLNTFHRFAEAEAIARPVAAQHRMTVIQQVLDQALSGQGKRVAADSAMREAARTIPGFATTAAAFRANNAFVEHDPYAAVRTLDSIPFDSLPGSVWYAAKGLQGLVLQSLGQSAGAAREFGELASRGWLEGARGGALGNAVEVAYDRVASRGDRPGAVARLRDALTRYPLDSIPAIDRPYLALAFVYAELGQRTEAERMHALWLASPASRHPYPWDAPVWAVAMARASGADADLVGAAKALQSATNCDRCGLYDMGMAYDRMGQGDSALAAWVKAEGTTVNDDAGNDAVWGAPVLFRMGELYEGKGEKAKAMDSYERFIGRWRTADADLQPRVAEARRRVARLKAATG